MTINSFTIEYDAIKGKNYFTNGDIINGRIILELSKQVEVQSLMFIASGRADVAWTEHHGNHGHHGHPHTRHHWAKEAYYEVKQHILRETGQAGSNVINMGRNVFPFTFQVPNRKMPSTFKHQTGKVVHKLKAELKRSMRLTDKAKQHFIFVSRPDLDIPGLMEPQYNCKDKKLSLGSGNVTMDVRTKKMGYMPGENIELTAEINNNCSRSVKPKIVLYEKKIFLAQGHRRLYTVDIIKEKFDAISSSGKQTLKKVITIPSELPLSITNCSIIKLEYWLKVFLDIKYAADPEVKLPIVVIPAVVFNPGGYPAPPGGYPAPPGGYPAPPGGYPAPQGGYPAPPGGFPAPPGGYPAPQGGYPAPPGGFPAPPGGYPAPQGGYPAPPGGYPAPSGGNPAQPGGYPAPPGGYPAPQGGYPAPSGGNPAQPGGYPAPPGGFPAPSGGYPAPPGGSQAPPRGYPAPPSGSPAPPGGYPAPSGGYPAPPVGNPNQPYVYPGQSTKTNPGAPPPAYSASSLYPAIDNLDMRKDKF